MSLSDPLLESVRFIRHLAKWYVLAFASGAVNVGALMACGRFATHVTGFGAHIGLNLAVMNWRIALGMALVPTAYLSGAIFASLCVDGRINRGKQPRYRLPLILAAVLIGAAASGGHFGLFGDTPDTHHDFMVLVLLASASGMQNALTTTLSDGLARVSHMTGNTTDIGIGLVRILIPPPNPVKTEGELRKLWLRVGILTAFIVGSLLGALLYHRLGYPAFLFPATAGLLAALLYR